MKQASSLLSDALSAVEPTDPVARATAGLRRQVSRLAAENSELRHRLMALTQLLIDRNRIDSAGLAAAVERFQLPSDLEVVDDTDTPVTEETESATVELIELRKAVEDQQQA